MTRETFVPKTFQATTLTVIEQANAIIAEYEAQSFTLSLHHDTRATRRYVGERCASTHKWGE